MIFLVYVLTKFVEGKVVMKLDSAFCNISERKVLMGIFSHSCLAIEDNIQSDNGRYVHQWVHEKSIKYKSYSWDEINRKQVVLINRKQHMIFLNLNNFC